jgi:uncharacterized Zn-binding protein involved in type VI secretion
MGKMVVVQGDAVHGTDKHKVKGDATNPGAPPPTVPYVGVGSYTYTGKMIDALSTFVQIGGKAVALVTSKSSLNPGETVPPTGGHSGPAGSGFVPPTPVPIALTLSITDSIGTGIPNAAAGSALLTIGGVKVLLEGDKIDTCDGLHVPANSTVIASGQSFVSCSA